MRIQVRGVENLAEAGLAVAVAVAVAEAGLDLANAAQGVLEPTDGSLPVSDALDALRDIHIALGPAVDQVAALDGYRLLSPLDDVRQELLARLPDVATSAEAEDGVGVLISVMGRDGPAGIWPTRNRSCRSTSTSPRVATSAVLPAKT